MANAKFELLQDDTKEFWSLVDNSGSCWIWTGAFSGNGYGSYKRHGSAHRIAYELATGECITGMHIKHSCDNKKCVNPAHLAATTHSGNMRDMTLKGRHARSKLSISDILKIREVYADGKKSQSTIAREFGVHQASIFRVLSGKTTISAILCAGLK